LTTFNGVLPQGAPTSPYIANIVCHRMDKRLLALSTKIKANYSRYADDITISSDENIRKYVDTIKSIIIDEGFNINYRKLRLQTKNNMQEVTGLIVNENVKVKRKYKKRLEQHIYYCEKFGVYSHLQENGADNKSYFKEYLYGMANFVKMIEPEEGVKFLIRLDEINWGIWYPHSRYPLNTFGMNGYINISFIEAKHNASKGLSAHNFAHKILIRYYLLILKNWINGILISFYQYG